ACGRHVGLRLGGDVRERANRLPRGDGADGAGVRESAGEAHQGLRVRAIQLSQAMRRWLVAILTGLALATPLGAAAQPVALHGAGATFPAPLYRKWIAV